MTATIGVISTVQDISFFTQGYFRVLLDAAGRAIVGHDCVLRLISLTHAEFSSVESARILLAAQSCDALLVVAPHDTFMPTISALAQLMPAIVIGPPHLDLDVSYVGTDNYASGREVVRYLVASGRKQIVFVQPHPRSGDFWERERGYQAEMAASQLQPYAYPLTYPITDEAIDRFLIGRPDALIVPDDNHALRFLIRAKLHGLRIPEDIAVVGFDDEDFAAETNPALTTVRQPVAEVATRAAAYLLDRLSGVQRGLYRDLLPNTLIVRSSA